MRTNGRVGVESALGRSRTMPWVARVVAILGWGTSIGAGLAFAACEGDTPRPAEVLAAIPRQRVGTLGSGVTVELPVDLVVQPFSRALFATSADGGYRFYLGERPETLVEAMATFKEEVVGLGWEIEGEQHFATALRVDLFKGPKQQRLYRQTWLVGLEAPDDKPRTAVCEALAREPHRARLDEVLRRVCEGLQSTPAP